MIWRTRARLLRDAGRYRAHVLAERVRPPTAKGPADVPLSAQALTVEYLSAVLCAGQPGARVEAFELGRRTTAAAARPARSRRAPARLLPGRLVRHGQSHRPGAAGGPVDERPEGTYRMMGFVHLGIVGYRQRFGLHAVGRFLRFDRSAWPAGGPRRTSLELIGSGIDTEALRAVLRSCERTEPAHRDSMAAVLRYRSTR